MSKLSSRLRALVDSLDKLEADAMLVTDETNVRYLSGFTGDSSYLLVRQGEVTILSDGRYETQIANECGDISRVIRPPSQLLPDLTHSVLSDLPPGERRVAIESDQMTLAAYRDLAARCESIKLVETTGVVARQRMIKDDEEITIVRQAVRVAERALESVRPMLSKDWTERAVAHELESNMRFLGADGCSFAPIVAAGPAAALPHYYPCSKRIGGATLLLIDWGASYLGYASDLTRTFHTDAVTDQFASAYEAVLEAQLAAIESIRPGVVASEVDEAARRVLDRAGLGDAFKHGLGHGIGLQIHESPRMSSVSKETLASGMVITVEPGVYFEGEFGIRIEDDVLVTDSGCEVLSQLPKGLDESRIML